jgi:hypothetical protein
MHKANRFKKEKKFLLSSLFSMKNNYLCRRNWVTNLFAVIKKWPRSLMDRASDYGSEGWGFESLRGHWLVSHIRS